MQHPIQIDSAGGEYMETVVVLEWAVALGAAVKAGDTVVTVETAKAATEIAAPADGFLTEIRFDAGQEAPVGVVLGHIGDSLAEPQPAPQPAPQAPSHPGPQSPPAAPQAASLAELQKGRLRATPLARRIARNLSVDLAQVAGTGPHGRIKRADVEAAATTPPLAAPAQLHRVTPLVLIHGFGADRASWRPVAGLLPAQHPLVMPELPGHGQAAPRPVQRIEDLAFAIADDLRAQGIESAHLVGHSLGGAVAIALADLGLVAARSLVLIAPGGLGPEANTAFLHGLAGAETPEALQGWLDQMVADPASLPAGFARAVLRQRDRAGNGAALAQMAAALFGNGVQLLRLRQSLQRLTMPAKVIWGRADRILPPSHAADLPGHIGLHLLDGVGHVPQLENPGLVARLIVETLRAAED